MNPQEEQCPTDCELGLVFCVCLLLVSGLYARKRIPTNKTVLAILIRGLAVLKKTAATITPTMPSLM